MPRSGSTPSASPTLKCYSCNHFFPRSLFPAEFNEGGQECCPDCGGEFVELLDQGSSSPSSGGADTGAVQQTAAQDGRQGDAEASSRGAGEPRGTGTTRGTRIEFHAMFHPRTGDGAEMPLTFVDAISRFAPLSLPNGQQAFVLQVQDGALLSPFTMGVPFGDALALNPGDWVVGDDLDAVVTRVLDAYMPPRRATAPDVRDALPRLRVRPPGPLSPRPTSALEAAATKAASAASVSLQPGASASAASAPALITMADGDNDDDNNGSGGGAPEPRSGAMASGGVSPAGGNGSGVGGDGSGATATAAVSDGIDDAPDAATTVNVMQEGQQHQQGSVAQPPQVPQTQPPAVMPPAGVVAPPARAVAQQPTAVDVRLEPLVGAAGDGEEAGEARDGGGGVRLRLRYGDAGGGPEERVAAAAATGEGALTADAAGPVAGVGAVTDSGPCPGALNSPLASALDASGAAASDGGDGGITAAAASTEVFASCRPGELCTVCHDAFEAGSEVVQLPCQHCFHEDCILPWLQQQNTCPVCRTRLREGTGGGGGISNSNSQRQQQVQSHHQQQQRPGAATTQAAGAPGEPPTTTATARDRASDGAAADGAQQQQQPAPPLPQQQQNPQQQPQQRRLRPGAVLTPHFPLLNALRPQPPVAPPALSPEELQLAEAALEPLRARFTPLQLAFPVTATAAGAPMGAAASLPLFGGGAGALLPLFGGMAPAAQAQTRGSSRARAQARPPVAGSPPQAQQQGQGQGAATALRGGFFNNPLLNLYGSSNAVAAARANDGGAAASGTRSALRGGFFNSSGGGAGSAAGPQRPQSDGSGGGAAASGLGAARALPPRRQQRPPSPRHPEGGGGDAVAAGLPGVHTALRPEMLPRMIWSVSLANTAQQGGYLAVNPYVTPVSLDAAGNVSVAARGRGRAAAAAANTPAALAAPTGTHAAAAAASPSPPSSSSLSAAPCSPAAAPAAASAGVAAPPAAAPPAAAAVARPPRDEPQPPPLFIRANMAAMLSNPDLGSEAVLLQLARVISRLDRAGRPRPSESELRDLHRSALRAASQMAQMPHFGPPDPALMARIADVADRWLARATDLVRRPPRSAAAAPPAASSPSSSAAAGGVAAGGTAAAASQRGRPSNVSGQDADGDEEGALKDEGPTRQVARRTQLQDAATLAHLQHQKEIADQPTSDGPMPSKGADSGTGAAAAAAGAAGAEGGCAGVRSVRVRRGRVVGAVRPTAALTPTRGATTTTPAAAAAVAAAGARRRSASSVPRVPGPSNGGAGAGGSSSAGAAAAAAAVGGNSRNGGGGGGFNPLAVVVGGAGAGLRFLGGVAGGLFRRGRGSGTADGDGGGGNTNGDGAPRG